MMKKESNGRGGESRVFDHNGEYYYADKAYVPFTGIETMIFPCDESGKVTDWGELYCDRTDKPLDDCIEEFIAELDERHTGSENIEYVELFDEVNDIVDRIVFKYCNNKALEKFDDEIADVLDKFADAAVELSSWADVAKEYLKYGAPK